MAYDVPDFRNEEDRKKYEFDNITPFPDENGKVSVPCSSKPYSPSEDDLNTAREMWKSKDFLLR